IIIYNESTQIGGNPTATGGIPPYSYNWSPAEGLDAPNSPNPIASPVNNTIYTVTVTDANNYTSIDSLKITVKYPIEPEIEPDTALQDSIPVYIFDRFGRTYSKEDISKHESFVLQAGIFELTFTDNFDAETNDQLMSNVIRQVFIDLSALITPSLCNGTQPTVYIEVGSQADAPTMIGEPMPAQALGAASAYYQNTLFVNTTGIIYGDVWKAINQGVNSPDEFDGFIIVNFNHTWHFDLNTNPAAGSNSFDVYSVFLHEAYHTLDFASLIGANGQSLAPGILNHYTRFATYIESSLPGYVGKLINWDGNYNASYNFSSYPNPATPITAGCTNIIYNGTLAGQHPVYAPNPYEGGRSLSHFDNVNNICSSVNYLMAQSLAAEDYQRVPTPEEVEVLCDISYKTTGIFGDGTLFFHTSSLPSCGDIVAGVDDGFELSCNNILYSVQTCPGYTISVNPLANDNNVDHYESLVIQTLNAGTITSDDGHTFIFDPADNTIGNVILTYIPVGPPPDNIRGNITYVRIFRIPCGESCVTPENCNHICNYDFSDLSCNACPLPNQCGDTPFNDGEVNNWYNSHGSPQILCDNNNPCATMWAINLLGSASQSRSEGILTWIDVQPNTNYIFSYRRRVRPDITNTLDNIHIYLLQSTNSPGIPYSNLYPVIPPVPAVNFPVLIETNITSSTTYKQVTVCFQTPDDGIVYDWLWIYPEQNDGHDQVWLNVDNIELIQDNFDLGPDIININCGGDATIGAQYCTVAGIGYDWTILSGDVVDIIEIVPGFSPQAIVTPEQTTTYQLSRTFPQNPLTVTYDAPPECVLSDEITVNPSLTTASANSNSPICENNTIELTSSGGIFYSWTGPNGFSSTLQNPSISNANIVNAGIYTVTVTDANGCTGVDYVTVTVSAHMILTISLDNNYSCGACNGTASVTGIVNGTAPFYYLWDENTGNQVTQTATGLCGGTYSVTVTDANSCTGEDDVTVANPPDFWPSHPGDQTLKNFGIDMITDALGNVYVIAEVSSPSITFGALNYTVNLLDVFVIKYDNCGNVLWTKQISSGRRGPYIR
ncbi:MAG: hypothetical protein HY738_00535, partial [Bacteroidia bacterium]|nr:hypothetical protein [Bacteroidia bacterium]